MEIVEAMYERTENGVTTIVSTSHALAEVGIALSDDRRLVKTVNSDWGYHTIEYKNGRKVTLAAVYRRAEAIGTVDLWTGVKGSVVEAAGKRYIVDGIHRAEHTASGAYVRYWSERDGRTFGRTKIASSSARKGSVAHAVWNAALRLIGGESS